MRWLFTLCLAWGCAGSKPPSRSNDATCAPISSVVVAPIYPDYAGWNDYVRMSDPSLPRHRQPQAACLAASDGTYLDCIHGGEMRVVELPNEHTCVGLEIWDALHALTWRCDDSTGDVRAYSESLAPGRGLTDLLSGTTFLDNSVHVRRAACDIAASSSAVWWDNPIVALPEQADELAVLSDARTIHVATSSHTAMGYVLAGERQALVTLPDVTLTLSNDAPNTCVDENDATHAALICGAERSFAWVEGSFAGTGGIGVLFFDGARLRVHQARTTGFGIGVLLASTTTSLVSDSSASNILSKGFDLRMGSRNLVRDVRADACGHTGIHMGGETRSVLRDATVSNSSQGMVFEFSGDATLTGIVVSGCGVGVEVKGSGGATLHGLTLAANVTGLHLEGMASLVMVNAVMAGNYSGLIADSLTDARLRHLVVAGNPAGMVFNDSHEVAFDGLVLTDGPCAIDPSSDNIGLDPTCHYGPELALPPGNVSLGNSFVGAVTEDMANTVDVGGLWQNLADGPNDWSSFEVPWRVYLRESSGVFPATSSHGPCAVGELCHIWDWRLRDDDTTLRNVFGEYHVGARCPTSLDATSAWAVLTDAQTTPNTFLAHARELTGDHDGLCEADEACVFAPNLGAYQGWGRMSDACEMGPGEFGRVKMLGWERIE